MQSNNFRVLAKERCLSTFSAHYQCGNIVMVDDGDKLEPCPHCNDKPATVISAIMVKAEPVTPVKAGKQEKQEKQCPDAPKKAPSKPRANLQPIPISPALRFDAPVANWCDRCKVGFPTDAGRIFCSHCGDRLIERNHALRDYQCGVCDAHLKLESDDRFCLYCGSSVNAAVSNYPIAYVEFGKVAEEDTVVNVRFVNWNTNVVLLKGTKTVGVCAPTDIMRGWDLGEWKVRSLKGEWTLVNPKLIRIHENVVNVLMK